MHSKGRVRGKREAPNETRGREGGKCFNDAVVFAIPPLIKYAKPGELWNVWLKILNLSP